MKQIKYRTRFKAVHRGTYWLRVRTRYPFDKIDLLLLKNKKQPYVVTYRGHDVVFNNFKHAYSRFRYLETLLMTTGNIYK